LHNSCIICESSTFHLFAFDIFLFFSCFFYLNLIFYDFNAKFLHLLLLIPVEIFDFLVKLRKNSVLSLHSSMCYFSDFLFLWNFSITNSLFHSMLLAALLFFVVILQFCFKFKMFLLLVMHSQLYFTSILLISSEIMLLLSKLSFVFFVSVLSILLLFLQETTIYQNWISFIWLVFVFDPSLFTE